MLENVDTSFSFLTLDTSNVSKHTSFSISLGKSGYRRMVLISCRKPKMSLFFNLIITCGEGICVKTTKSNELPDKSEFAELLDVRLHIIVMQTSSIPVFQNRRRLKMTDKHSTSKWPRCAYQLKDGDRL